MTSPSTAEQDSSPGLDISVDHSLHQLLGTYWVPDTIPGTEDTVENLCGADILEWKPGIKTSAQRDFQWNVRLS